MNSHIYYCASKNNICPKKDSCKRYIESKNSLCNTTLYKASCTQENNFVLYFPIDNQNTKGGEHDIKSIEEKTS